MPSEAQRVRERNLALIRSNLLDLRRSAPKRKLQRLPRLIWPGAIERTYRRNLEAIVDKIAALTKIIVVPALPEIVATAAATRPKLDAYDYTEQVERVMQLIRSGIFGVYTDPQIAAIVQQVAEAISLDNKRQLGEIFTKVLGVDVFQSEPWLAGETRAFVKQNVDLIKTIPRKHFEDMERNIFDGARSGLRWQEIAKTIEDVGATKYRAEVIARDQVGKFNGQLAMLRQTGAGVDKYRWRGVLDARERPHHVEREGVIFSWDAPPADGHPGDPILCRCYAEPYLDDFEAALEAPDDPAEAD